MWIRSPLTSPRNSGSLLHIDSGSLTPTNYIQHPGNTFFESKRARESERPNGRHSMSMTEIILIGPSVITGSVFSVGGILPSTSLSLLLSFSSVACPAVPSHSVSKL